MERMRTADMHVSGSFAVATTVEPKLDPLTRGWSGDFKEIFGVCGIY